MGKNQNKQTLKKEQKKRTLTQKKATGQKAPCDWEV